jgi:YidC/Oxa1 family membrane protein insertase
MLLLIPLYYIIREPITWLMFHGDVDAKTVGEIQNIFLAAKQAAAKGTALHELNATGFYWQMEALPFINDVKAQLAAISPEIVSMNTRFFGVELATVPHLMFWQYFDIHGVWNSIGQFLLPMLSGGINLLSMWMSQKMNNTVIVNEKGEQDTDMAKSSPQNNKVMTLMMPLFSVYIGFIAPAGLSLYWFLQGLFSMIQDYFLTKHYKQVYDAEDAVKQAKAAEEAAQEAERERLRAQRRAENPDGMLGSASKKKLQQREKNEQAAKEAAYQAAQAALEGREPASEDKRQLDGDRPFRKGRNYDPDRYKNNKE